MDVDPAEGLGFDVWLCAERVGWTVGIGADTCDVGSTDPVSCAIPLLVRVGVVMRFPCLALARPMRVLCVVQASTPLKGEALSGPAQSVLAGPQASVLTRAMSGARVPRLLEG